EWHGEHRVPVQLRRELAGQRRIQQVQRGRRRNALDRLQVRQSFQGLSKPGLFGGLAFFLLSESVKFVSNKFITGRVASKHGGTYVQIVGNRGVRQSRRPARQRTGSKTNPAAAFQRTIQSVSDRREHETHRDPGNPLPFSGFTSGSGG